MARPRDDARRQQLLEEAVDHVCEKGLSDLSLRGLARALDVEASLLTHHFGGKEPLLALILNGVRDRLRGIGALDRASTPDHVARQVWSWASDPARRDLYLLFFEVYALALRRPDQYADFLRGVISDWLEPLTGVFVALGADSAEAESRATIAVALIRGLLLDLLTTGNRARVEQALFLAIHELSAVKPPQAPMRESRGAPARD